MKLGVLASVNDRSLGIADLARQVEGAGLESLFLTQNTNVPASGAALRHGVVARAIARDTAAAGGRDTSLCGSLCETDPNPARLVAQNDVIEAWIVGLAGGDEPVHEVREVDRGHLWSDAGWKPVVEDIGVDRLPRRGPGVGAQQDKELAVAAAELGTVQIDYEWENRWQDVCGKLSVPAGVHDCGQYRCRQRPANKRTRGVDHPAAWAHFEHRGPLPVGRQRVLGCGDGKRMSVRADAGDVPQEVEQLPTDPVPRGLPH